MVASSPWRASASSTKNGNGDDGSGSVTLTCTRANDDPNTLGFCIRNQPGGVATAGIYADTVNIIAEYGDAFVQDTAAPRTYTVGVNAQCIFHTYPGTMICNYTSFSPTPQTAWQDFVLRCSTGLPWSVTVDPPVSAVLGLDYAIAASPNSGTGNGNTNVTVRLTGTIPAGQAGTCALGSCTATQAHTVIISY